jgi:hypothetical protein
MIRHLPAQREPALRIRLDQLVISDPLSFQQPPGQVVILHLGLEEIVLPRPGNFSSIAAVCFHRVVRRHGFDDIAVVTVDRLGAQQRVPILIHLG